MYLSRVWLSVQATVMVAFPATLWRGSGAADRV